VKVPPAPEEPAAPLTCPFSSVTFAIVKLPPETLKSWVSDCPLKSTAKPVPTIVTVKPDGMRIGAVKGTEQLPPYAITPPAATAEESADSVQVVIVAVATMAGMPLPERAVVASPDPFAERGTYARTTRATTTVTATANPTFRTIALTCPSRVG
jgi:hypothetical protein